jgi:hypothetical protein
MTTKKLLLTAAIAVMATVSFGQVSKTSNSLHPNSASDKQKQHNALLPPKSSTANRSVRSSTLLLDSMVTQMNPAIGEENEKTTLQYNAAGNLILETGYVWNAAAQQWKERLVRGYDDRGNLILYIEWDDYDINYSQKHEYAYDNLNWLTSEASYKWENGQWVGEHKDVYAYTDFVASYVETHTKYEWLYGDWRISSKGEQTLKGTRQMLEPGEGINADVAYIGGVSFPALPAATDNDYVSSEVLSDANWNYSNGILYGGNKREYTRNATGYITQIKYFDWNTTANAWEEWNIEKRAYAFNTQGLLTEFSVYYWDYESNWVFDWWASYTIAYTFDGGNNVLSFTKTSIGYLGNNIKTEYTYDVQNRAVTALVYDYDGDEWIKNGAYERTFDNYGNVILGIEKHNWYDGIWHEQREYEAAFDADGRQTMYSYIDNGYYHGWGRKYEYAFDVNGNVIMQIYYEYDYATQAFIPEEKTEYTFGNIYVDWFNDGGYNTLSIIRYFWYNNDWVVQMEGKYEWTFDAENNPLFANLSIKDNGQWAWYGTMTWYYSLHEISGLSAVTNSEFLLWISGDKLQITGAPNGDIAQIFDIQGRQIVNYRLNSNSIDISNLPKGVYILKLGNVAKKFFKE